MNPEMEENLQDLKDIRNHMYRYYDVGQEYIRQQEILERYEKAEERWAPKNKKKILLISIGICILLGPTVPSFLTKRDQLPESYHWMRQSYRIPKQFI